MHADVLSRQTPRAWSELAIGRVSSAGLRDSTHIYQSDLIDGDLFHTAAQPLAELVHIRLESMQILCELPVVGVVFDRHLFRMFQTLFHIGDLMFDRTRNRIDSLSSLNLDREDKPNVTGVLISIVFIQITLKIVQSISTGLQLSVFAAQMLRQSLKRIDWFLSLAACVSYLKFFDSIRSQPVMIEMRTKTFDILMNVTDGLIECLSGCLDLFSIFDELLNVRSTRLQMSE